jgi:predicted protein tyrosine phosphatase
MINRNRLGVLQNPYQGKHKKILTVCSAGCLRSPTAAHILSSEPFNFNTRCAGISKEYAIIPVDYGLITWADEIIVMDSEQQEAIIDMQNKMNELNDNIMFDFEFKPVHNLDIADMFSYRDPRLVELMTKKFKEMYIDN